MPNSPYRSSAMIILTYLLSMWLLFLLSGCGDGNPVPPSDTSSHDTGAAVFNIQWLLDGNGSDRDDSISLNDWCANNGVVELLCDVYDDTDYLVGTGGSWKCSDGKGEVSAIIPGSKRIFVIYGVDAEGDIIFQGQSLDDVVIMPGVTSHVGKISVSPFVSKLDAPKNKALVVADAFTLKWSELSGAHEYLVFVSDDKAFSAFQIEKKTSQTKFTPLCLSEGREFYWKVLARDKFGNYGGESEVWQFSTDDYKPPDFSPTRHQTVKEEKMLAFTVNVSDSDTSADALVYSTGDLPVGAAFDSLNRRFTWTPDVGMAGDYTVQFTVCTVCTVCNDCSALCDSMDITITVVPKCDPDLDPPLAAYKRTEDDTDAGGQSYTRHILSIENRDLYSDDFSVKSPSIGSCDQNADASRTWVDIYDQDDNLLQRFCNLTSSSNLDSVWFDVSEEKSPPNQVYITLEDHECDIIRSSNMVSIPLPCPQTIAGEKEPHVRVFDMGSTSGTFTFRYETYFVRDNMIVSYEGRELFRSGCVSAIPAREIQLEYSGDSSLVTVEVDPLCFGSNRNSTWKYTVSCSQ